MRAIYRRRSDGVLFAMDDDAFRLGHRAEDYAIVTGGRFEKGRVRAPNGFSARVFVAGDTRYFVYVDGSAGEI